MNPDDPFIVLNYDQYFVKFSSNDQIKYHFSIHFFQTGLVDLNIKIKMETREK